MKSLIVRLTAIAVMLVLASAAPAAGWIGQYSGYSERSQSPLGDGTVNFAVYDNVNSDLGLSLSASSGTATGRYVYFYQVVNTNPQAPERALSDFYVSPRGPFTGVGFVANTIFEQVVGSSTYAIGPSNSATSRARLDGGSSNGNPFDNSVNGAVSENNQAPTGFVTRNAAVEPVSISTNSTDPVSGSTNAIRFNFGTSTPNSPLPTDAYTSLLFITSNNAPLFGRGTLTGNPNSTDNARSTGDVPVPSPEPATLGLIALGMSLVGGLGVARRMRGRKEEVEAAPEAQA